MAAKLFSLSSREGDESGDEGKEVGIVQVIVLKISETMLRTEQKSGMIFY